MAVWKYIEGKDITKKFKKGDKCPYDKAESCKFDYIEDSPEENRSMPICDDYPFESDYGGVCRCTAQRITAKYIEIKRIKVKMRVIRD